MNPAAAKARTVFEKAIAVAAPERERFVAAACAGDEGVRREVDSLLAAHANAGSFMKTPVVVPLPQMPLQGTEPCRFGDYELLEEIARGGMGVVFKARQVSLDRVVALKMILAGRFASQAEVRRFHTEARAAASLHHRNIVGIFEVGEHQGQHYYTMPLLQGQNLAQLVESGHWRPGDGTDAARLVGKVAHAVQYAHENGILHRDLKPGNILIDAEGEPCVTDFGLAKWVKGDSKLTVTGDLLGTPGFMPPEQARGRAGQATPATDVYSLGAVLYYLLTGRPPFVADTPLDALWLVLESEAVLPRRINPLVSGHLERICLRCLNKRPEDRYPSARALAVDLERFLMGDSLADNSPAIGRRFEAWAKRRPALAARICTGLVCLAIVVTAFFWEHYTTPGRHLAVDGVLLAWLAVSFLCQWGVGIERHAHWVRLVWSAADPAALTFILLLAQAFYSPLVILYPTLIAASGFSFRVSLVASTTVLSLLGYGILLFTADPAGSGKVHGHWHLLACVAMIVTGLAVAYLVNRVSALTRFYERHPVAGY